MRIGLAGVGRIGAFHAETLRRSPRSTPSWSPMPIPAGRATVASRLGVEAAESPDALFGPGIDGLVIAAATDAHAALIVAASTRHADLLREAGRPRRRRDPRRARQGPRRGRAGAHRLPAPVRRRVRRRPRRRCSPASSAGCTPCGPARSTRRRRTPEYIAASGGFFRDCSVHDFDIIRWVTGREVREVYAAGANRGEDFFAEAGDVDTAAAVLTLDDDTLRPRVGDPLQRARATTSGSRCSGRRTASRSAWTTALPLRSVEPASRSPPGVPYPMFMERFRPAYVAELTAFTEVVARPSAVAVHRRRRPARRSTSPRPASCPGASTARCRVDEVRR